MSQRLLLVALVTIALCGCKKKTPPTTTPVGAGKADVVVAERAERPADVTVEPSSPDVGGAADTVPAADVPVVSAEPMPPLDAVSWTLAPAQLDVMRNTDVTMKATWEGADRARFTCLWDPGDRTGILRGCEQKHTYENGLADRQVTLEIVVDGKPVFSETRRLPLERLPVHEMPKDDQAALPAAPGEQGSRMLVWAAFEAPSKADVTALKKALVATEAEGAVLFFNMAVEGSSVGGLIDDLQRTTGTVVLPVFCGPVNGAEAVGPMHAGFVAHGKTNEGPYRHAAVMDGVGYVVLDSRIRGNDMEHEKWMLEQLEGLRIAAHRVVVSCRPMETLTGDGDELTPQFRFYEKLLRGDISALLSSGDPVFYNGAYGDLTAVSAGCAVGEPGTLEGAEEAQEPLVVVLDMVRNKGLGAYAVPLSDPSSVLDPSLLPRQVGNTFRRF